MKKWSIMSLFLGLIMLPGSVLAAENPSPTPTVTETAKPAIEATSVQQQPYKVALLGVVDVTGATDKVVRGNVAKQLNRELHVPLNGYLQRIKLFDEAESLAALKTLPPEVQSSRERNVVLKGIAEKLEADLSLCVTVETYYEHTWVNWRGDFCFEAYVTVSLDGWDTKLNKPIHRQANRWERDEVSTSNGAEQLLYDAVDELLKKEKLRDRFFPSK